MNKLRVNFPNCYESERLILRKYLPGDAKWYYAMSLKNHQHLMRYESENATANITSLDEAVRLISELDAAYEARHYFFVGAFQRITNEFVAQIYIGPVDGSLPEFKIGYFVDVDHEGQGYVSEAVRATLRILFDHLDAHRVDLACDETNLRSIRVAERSGMMREGYLGENKRNPDGTYSGSLIFRILKSEYEAAKNLRVK